MGCGQSGDSITADEPAQGGEATVVDRPTKPAAAGDDDDGFGNEESDGNEDDYMDDDELKMEMDGMREVNGEMRSRYDRGDKRPEGNADFAPVENIEGEEFLAVRPWIGAIKEPSNPPDVNTDAPDAGL